MSSLGVQVILLFFSYCGSYVSGNSNKIQQHVSGNSNKYQQQVSGNSNMFLEILINTNVLWRSMENYPQIKCIIICPPLKQ